MREHRSQTAINEAVLLRTTKKVPIYDMYVIWTDIYEGRRKKQSYHLIPMTVTEKAELSLNHTI